MDKQIVVFDADEKQCQDLCGVLEKQHYQVRPIHSLPNLEEYLKGCACLVVIVDLNTTSIDNRVIRELTIKNPGVYFLGLTKHRLNPELKESICYHIYACLTKPFDPDELFYWLKCIFEDGAELKDQPGA